MVQWVKALGTEPEDLSLILGTQVRWEEKTDAYKIYNVASTSSHQLVPLLTK